MAKARGIEGLIQQVPKVIEPKTHMVLDYLTIGGFFTAGALFWKKSKPAAWSAFANGAFVLSYTLFTDYPGSIKRLIRFPTHGKLDLVQATAAATMPLILRFADEPYAKFFYGQALNETSVLAMTDFQGQRASSRRQLKHVA
jgi:hypothetical protein